MKRLLGLTLVLLMSSGISCGTAFAQAGLAGTSDGVVRMGDTLKDANPFNPDDAKPPPNLMSPLPTRPQAPLTVEREAKIPDLPPAVPCEAKNLLGLWELQHVYESPIGSETQAYNLSPVQYMAFARDSRLYRFNAGKNQYGLRDVLMQMKGHTGAVLQYLLQDAGMLYFYKDSVATETQVCFMVAETRPPYAAGNLLLIPPKGAIPGRLVKVYKKIPLAQYRAQREAK